MKSFEYKKSLGQNFLIDQNVLNKIINSIHVENDSIIIEIGTGKGALTKELIKLNNKIISFEIDERLKEYLDKIKASNLEIIYEDFISFNLKEYLLKKEYNKLYFVANIPYYITTSIINKIHEYDAEEIVLMIQEEVADRIITKNCSKEYNEINVLLQYDYNISKIMSISANSFYPKPHVNSALIKLTKRSNKEYIKNYEHFKKIVKDSFKHKRKNLRNNLREYDLKVIETCLQKHNKDLAHRAENISVEEFVNISNELN